MLPVRTVLDGSYRIERVVGSGGFGITYQAEDINLGTMVAIKEYYPFDFGDRDATMSVRPKSDRHRRTFEWGRLNFLQEARTLARFEHPSIVRVTRVFEANSTAYMVMRFEQGQSLHAWLIGLDRPPTQEELNSIVFPLLDAMQVMHAANFLHRDIAPDNIMVRKDGTSVLLDFGAARRAVAEVSRSLSGIVKAGYSPHEQYSTDGRLQGPWSDLYALGATLYRAVTGSPPEEATLRTTDDRTPPAVQAAAGMYRLGFLAAIDACLKIRHTERPQSVTQLRPMFLQEALHPPPKTGGTQSETIASRIKPAAGRLGFSFAVRASKGAKMDQEDAATVHPGMVRRDGSVEQLTAALADGIGTKRGGALASSTACQVFLRAFETSSGDVSARLEEALRFANAAVAACVDEDPALDGMGTTLLGAFLGPAGLEWVSVGDSPLYLVRDGEIVRVNEDHSLAPEIDMLAAAGRMGWDDARSDPRRNQLRSSLTGGDLDLIDRGRPLSLEPKDVVILASDGIQTLEESDILRVVREHAGRGPEVIVGELIGDVERARDPNQGNTTIIVVCK